MTIGYLLFVIGDWRVAICEWGTPKAAPWAAELDVLEVWLSLAEKDVTDAVGATVDGRHLARCHTRGALRP